MSNILSLLFVLLKYMKALEDLRKRLKRKIIFFGFSYVLLIIGFIMLFEGISIILSNVFHIPVEIIFILLGVLLIIIGYIILSIS